MDFLKKLKIKAENSGVSTGENWLKSKGKKIVSYSPVNGKAIAAFTTTDEKSYEAVVKKAQAAFEEWRHWPAPKRGEVVQ